MMLYLQKAKQQWQLSLLFLLFLPLLLSLGFWQLDREEVKQQLLLVYQEQKKLPPKRFNPSVYQTETHYQRVRLEGVFDQHRYWFLDNQPRSEGVGYEVVMPLLVGNQWVLVNRGWIKAPRYRDQLPEIDTPEGKVVIEGYFYRPSNNAIFNQSGSDLLMPWPKRVLQLSHEQASVDVAESVYPTQLRIHQDSPGAFITRWPIVNTQPEKHQAYAVQWFLMAVVLGIMYSWMLVKTGLVADKNTQNTISPYNNKSGKV